MRNKPVNSSFPGCKKTRGCFQGPDIEVDPDGGTHRRGGQAGPPDGLGARVQGSVFGLVQDRVHAEGLLAVHRHHDCGREGGSLCVVLVRIRFGSD